MLSAVGDGQRSLRVSWNVRLEASVLAHSCHDLRPTAEPPHGIHFMAAITATASMIANGMTIGGTNHVFTARPWSNGAGNAFFRLGTIFGTGSDQ